MARAVIGFPEWSREVTFTGAGWHAQYPVTNLGGYELPRVARSNALTANFTAELEQLRPIQMLGFCAHNMSRAGQYRVRMYRDAAKTQLVYDSGYQYIWPVVYGYEERDFYTPNFWFGQYTPNEIRGQYPTSSIWLPQRYYVTAIEVDLVDTNTAGFIDLGYFSIAEGWQLSVNPSEGAEFGFEMNDLITKTSGGSKYVDERPKARLFRGTVDYMNMQEVKERAYEMWRQLGTTIPFLWILDPADTRNQVRDSYLAQLEEPGLFRFSAYAKGAIPLNIREVI